MELRKVRLKDTVVKDIKDLIDINGIGSSKFIDFKIEQMVVNSAFLKLQNQNKIMFDRVVFADIKNDLKIIGVDSS